MSVNLPILDQPKPWLPLRCQNLQIDGKMTLSNEDFTISNYGTAAVIGGSFVVAPTFRICRVIRVGARVTYKLPPFAIINSNQAASGVITIQLNVRAEDRVAGNTNFQIISSGADGVQRVTHAQLNASSDLLQLFFTPSSTTWTKAAGDVRTLGDTYLTWIAVGA